MNKGDIVLYKNTKAKIIGKSMKGGKLMYKLRLYDSFRTVIQNVEQRDIKRE